MEKVIPVFHIEKDIEMIYIEICPPAQIIHITLDTVFKGKVSLYLSFHIVLTSSYGVMNDNLLICCFCLCRRIVNDTYRTDLCLLYPPFMIALGR